MALAAVLLPGCLAPTASNVKVPAWEVPASVVMLPFDSIICATTWWDEAKAKKGDAGAALSLAKQHLDWGMGRSYFEHQAQRWYAKAAELEHPQAQMPFEQWRKNYTPPLSGNTSDSFSPLAIELYLIFK